MGTMMKQSLPGNLCLHSFFRTKYSSRAISGLEIQGIDESDVAIVSCYLERIIPEMMSNQLWEQDQI
jgi:hypothetical protein